MIWQEHDKSFPYIQQVLKNKILRVLYCRPETEPPGKYNKWIDAAKKWDIQNKWDYYVIISLLWDYLSDLWVIWQECDKSVPYIQLLHCRSESEALGRSINWIDAAKIWDFHNKWDCGRSPIRWDDNNVNDANAADVAKITKIKVSSLDPGHVGCQMLKMLVVFQRSRKLNQCSAHFQLRSGSSWDKWSG